MTHAFAALLFPFIPFLLEKTIAAKGLASREPTTPEGEKLLEILSRRLLGEAYEVGPSIQGKRGFVKGSSVASRAWLPSLIAQGRPFAAPTSLIDGWQALTELHETDSSVFGKLGDIRNAPKAIEMNLLRFRTTQQTRIIE